MIPKLPKQVRGHEEMVLRYPYLQNECIDGINKCLQDLKHQKIEQGMHNQHKQQQQLYQKQLQPKGGHKSSKESNSQKIKFQLVTEKCLNLTKMIQQTPQKSPSKGYAFTISQFINQKNEEKKREKINSPYRYVIPKKQRKSLYEKNSRQSSYYANDTSFRSADRKSKFSNLISNIKEKKDPLVLQIQNNSMKSNNVIFLTHSVKDLVKVNFLNKSDINRINSAESKKYQNLMSEKHRQLIENTNNQIISEKFIKNGSYKMKKLAELKEIFIKRKIENLQSVQKNIFNISCHSDSETYKNNDKSEEDEEEDNDPTPKQKQEQQLQNPKKVTILFQNLILKKNTNISNENNQQNTSKQQVSSSQSSQSPKETKQKDISLNLKQPISVLKNKAQVIKAAHIENEVLSPKRTSQNTTNQKNSNRKPVLNIDTNDLLQNNRLEVENEHKKELEHYDGFHKVFKIKDLAQSLKSQKSRNAKIVNQIRNQSNIRQYEVANRVHEAQKKILKQNENKLTTYSYLKLSNNLTNIRNFLKVDNQEMESYYKTIKKKQFEAMYQL